VDRLHLAEDSMQWQAAVNVVMNLQVFTTVGGFSDQLSDCQILRVGPAVCTQLISCLSVLM
jgi:hypothetical protein